MRALAVATAWVGTGLVAGIGLFWAFLNTPESTVFTLALSGLLVLLLYAAVATTVTGLVLGWTQGWSRATLRRSASGMVPFLLPAALVGAFWWLVGRGLGWLDAHAGEVQAWFMVTFGVSNAGWLLDGLRRVGNALRWIVVPFLALVWHARLVTHGMRPLIDCTTLWRGLAPGRLLAVFGIAAVMLWAPLAYGLSWTPAGLPPTWIEPLAAAVKLGLITVSTAAGLALIGALAARASR